jgi:TIR domain-containing protein
MPTFISHHMKEAPDETEYQRLTSELRKAGIEFFDRDSIKPGETLASQLIEGIRTCGSCIFLATEKSVNSRWCLSELGAFWNAGRTIVAYAPDANFSDDTLPPLLKGHAWTDDIAQVIKVLKNEALQGAAAHSRILFFPFIDDHDQDAPKRDVISQAIALIPAESTNRFKTLRNLSDLDDDQLGNWTGLFLGMPYDRAFTASVIMRLVEWVRDGGRLVISGFELGERHHGTNLNQLTYHFGVQFNSDAVVHPRPTQPVEDHFEKRGATGPVAKDYDESLCFETLYTLPDDTKRYMPNLLTELTALLQDVRTLRLQNVCSLQLEPGAMPLVLAKPNRVRALTVESGRYSSPPKFKLATGKQTFEEPFLDPHRAVVALAPQGLTGKGRVLALGSWDFRSDEPCDNQIFLQNIWRWLKNDRRTTP